jgi:hypothetical protein
MSAPQPPPNQPWQRYSEEKGHLLLEPGYAGMLADDELSYIQGKLQADPALAFAWGFRPGQKLRSEAGIRRVAMFGDPDRRATNLKLARRKSDPASSAPDMVAGSSFLSTKK